MLTMAAADIDDRAVRAHAEGDELGTDVGDGLWLSLAELADAHRLPPALLWATEGPVEKAGRFPTLAGTPVVNRHR
jgi:hypothetical protein